MQIQVNLKKNEIVFVIVDGATSLDEGSYTLRVDEICFPECAGKECGDDQCGGVCGVCAAPKDICSSEGLCLEPAYIDGNTCSGSFEIPGNQPFFEGQADTGEAWNHYRFGDEHCPGFVGKGGASKDQVWRLSSPEAADYRVELIPDGFDGVLYAVTDCADMQKSCFVTGDGTAGDIINLSLAAGESVYIVVDGDSNEFNESGPYVLRATRM